MPEQIGNINVPVILPSTTFPLISDFPHGIQILPRVAIHPFLSGSVKIEQRFLLGTGARRWRVLFNRSLTEVDLVVLRDFWEDRSGSYAAFTYNAPSDDGTSTTAYTVRFEDEPLTFERFANMLATSGVTLVEIPSDASAPVYSIASTLERFPDTAQESALTAQVQKLIPLISITTKTSGYPVIYLSDRRCTVGGQLYQPRLLTWSNITQRLGGQSDNANFIFGNADKVMRDLAADVDLFKARLRFSLYDITTGVLVNLWSGDIVNYRSTSTSEFGIEAVDGLWSLNLQYPLDRIRPTCWKKYNDGINCPFGAEGALDLVNFPSADAGTCDRGYLTANGCKAHGMKHRFGGVIATPQSIRTKDNSQGFFGFGRPTETATSIVNDSMMGQPLTEIYTDIPMPVKCLLIEGRDEGDFYIALGIIGAGPITTFDTGSFNAAGLQRLPTLDSQTYHLFPRYLGRFIPGTDPAGAGDWLSLDQIGTNTGGDPDIATDGTSLFLDHFSAGVAFAVIRIKDEKGFQLTTLDQHSMEVYVSEGIKGWVWTAPGTRTLEVLTNPVWLAIHVYLRGIGLRNADAATAEATFDVDAAIASAAICDISVDKVIGSGTETQFKFQGMLRDVKPLKDWIQEILNNCLGIYWFRNGKLTIGIREDAAAAHSFAGGNMIYQSLELSPIRPAFNKIDITFANADYEFVADSIPVNDIDRIEYDGEAHDSTLNLAGAAGKSMAGRIGATRLKEEQGGVGASEWKKAREARWRTTVLALGVEPGTGISIDDPDVPGGTGLFRVNSWTLNRDYSIDLEGRTITDTMYDLVAGPKASDVEANGTPGQLFPAPLQPVWMPNSEEPRVDDPIFDEFDKTFDIRTVILDQTDGNKRLEIQVRGEQPVNKFRYPNPPRIRTHSVGSGGSLTEGSYWVSVAATVGKYPTPNSNIVAMQIADGVTDGTLTIGNIRWPIGTWDGYTVFAGKDDNRMMTAQLEGLGTPSSITLTGLYYRATYGPPSPVYKAIRLKLKRLYSCGALANYITDVQSGGVISCAYIGANPYQPNEQAFDPPTDTDQALFATDDWTGRILSVFPQSIEGLSDGNRENGFVPVLDFTITAYDSNTGAFTVTPDPVLAGVLPGDVFVVRHMITFASDGLSFTDPGWVHGQNPAGLRFLDLEKEKMIARIIAGPGRGQWRNVIDRVGGDGGSLVIDRPWDSEDFPDTSSILILEFAAWVSFSEAVSFKQDHFGVSVDLGIATPNMRGHAFLVMGFLIDRNQQESPEEFSPLREFFVFGSPTPPGEAPFVVLREKWGKLTINDSEITADEGIGALRQMNFLTPMVDERDAHWWLTGSMAASGDPTTVTINMTLVRTSRFGISFQPGDFGIWNDPVFGYEINKVLAIVSTGGATYDVTLERTDPNPDLGTPLGEAYFHTSLVHHTNCAFFRLTARMNSATVRKDTFGTVRPTANGIPAKYEFDLPDSLIASVTSQAIGDQASGPIYSLALTTIGASTSPRCPGFRTLTGNKYEVGYAGIASTGAHADFRGARLADFLGFGALYAYCTTPPIGSDLIVYVVYIDPTRTTVGMIDILKIAVGNLNSYPSLPDDQQMPYHANGWVPATISPTDWPTTILPELVGALDGNDNLQTGFTVTAGNPVYVEPTGYLDFIVTQGSVSDLVIVIRT